METKLFFENFERKKKAIGLIHKVYCAQLKTSRNYTASTKTRAEVQGGGRKPWQQKGSGRARAGSTRSPLWVGGGVIFGPKPRTVYKKINKKERRLALLSALELKKKNSLIIEETLFDNFNDKKTKSVITFFNNLNISNESSDRILVVLSKPNKEFKIAARNLKNVEVTLATSLNLKQLLNTNKIVLSTLGVELINKTYGKSYT
jgi:large subunit ribosomal protein L4